MKLSISLCRCRIKILPLIVFICLFALLVWLGFWQLGRAEEKREFLINLQQKMQRDVLPIDKLLAGEKDLRYRRVTLEGHYDVKHQFLLDSQFHNGQVGYFVLTPFIFASGGKVVLINRGWVVMNKDRKKLPDTFFTPVNKLSVVGVINHFPEVGLVLKGADEPGKGWPSVVQLIDAQKISNKLNQSILDFQIQLSAEQPYGYVREWQINTRITPDKHVAYAFQWFVLAVTLTLLTLWGSCKIHNDD